MWRQIASFNGSILVLEVKNEKPMSLLLCCYEYEHRTKSFNARLKERQTFKSLPNDRPIGVFSCLEFKILFDRHCGIFLPYFVAQINDDLCCMFNLDAAKRKWNAKYYFQIPKVLGKTVQLDYVADCRIADGPTIIWTTGTEFFIYRAQYFANSAPCLLRVPLPTTDKQQMNAGETTTECCTSKILWWNSGLLPCDSDQGVVLFRKNDQSDVVAYHITLDIESQTPDIILTTCFIPPLYLAITTCCTKFHQCSLTVNNNLTKLHFRVFISTTQSQLVEFYNGQYVKHMNIPLCSCQSIHIFERTEDHLILLCSQQEKVCAVDWKYGKVLRNWSNVYNLLIDDFIGAGVDQVLVLSGNFEQDPGVIENFILCDFLSNDVMKSRNPVHNGKEAVVKDSDVIQSDENSMNKVMNALNQKVKATELSIMECKVEMSEKSAFVKKHCNMLRDTLLSKASTSSIQSSSLAIVLVGTEPTVMKGINDNSSKLVVLSKWQDLCNHEWIVGVEIKNVGERDASAISLCLVNKKDRILSSYSKSSENSGSSFKKENTELNKISTLAPGEKVTVTTISRIPDYTFERDFTVGLLLSWKQEKDGYSHGQYCGEITLPVDEVLKYETRISFLKPRVCPYLAYSLVETKLMVLFNSSFKDNVVEHLKSNMDVCHYCSDVSSCPKYHFTTTVLQTVHISLSNIQNGIILSIFTRDNSQLFLTLHALKENLPDGIVWCPLKTDLLIDSALMRTVDEVATTTKKLVGLLKARGASSLGDDLVNGAGNTSEGISAKRRKLSKTKDDVQRREGTFDSCSYLAKLSDVCYCMFRTENSFESLFLYYMPDS